ncbi:unnamed protein product [Ceutorhynchus assimilis]|uniref:Lipid-binding serum glycoprotein N-terminal domain-containing protein n=1 Tax=Ceutorhynchus assimilis TaxID=467358 RepID=A0A9P0DHC4_9CUCU|nr:unnamed protein product [Ceutorhynchus assimilis]
MKVSVFFFVFACQVAFGYEVQLKDGIVPQKLAPIQFSQEILPKVSWEHIRDIVLTKGELKAGYVQADVTEYVLGVMTDVQEVIVRQGYDPMELSDETINLFPGSVTLKNGWLSDASTITVCDSVIAKYTIATKVLDIVLPISFDCFLITYDYHTQIILLSINGDVQAEIKHFKLELELGFNFSSYHAYASKANVKDSGTISFKFTGLGLLDWIIDLMIGVFTTFFHGIILSVINLIIESPIQSIVSAINNAIDQFLQNNATVAVTY